MQNQQVDRLERELQSLNEQNELRRKQKEEIEAQKAARNRPRRLEEQDANMPDYNERSIKEQDSPVIRDGGIVRQDSSPNNFDM